MRLLQLLIYSNLLVSISASFLAFAIATKLGNPHYIGIGCVVFFATLFIYNFQRIVRIKEVKRVASERHLWLERNVQLLVFLSVIGIIGAVSIYFLVLGWNIDFWFLAFSAIMGILYAFKIGPNIIALRDIPYIKIFLIASQWMLVVVFWPYIRIAEFIDFPTELAISVFFFILAATVPFDLRDIVYDSVHKRTIPQLVGIKGAKIIAILFLIMSAIALYFSFPFLFTSPWFYLSYLGMCCLIIGTSTTRHEMYFSGWIDGWIIFYALLLFTL